MGTDGNVDIRRVSVIPDVGAHVHCPVCATELDQADAVYCIRCLTVHHQECFEYFGECATFGCGMDRCREGFPDPTLRSEHRTRTWQVQHKRTAFDGWEHKLVSVPRPRAQSTCRCSSGHDHRAGEKRPGGEERRAGSAGTNLNDRPLLSLLALALLFGLRLLGKAVVRKVEEFLAEVRRSLPWLRGMAITLAPFGMMCLCRDFPVIWFCGTMLIEKKLLEAMLSIG